MSGGPKLALIDGEDKSFVMANADKIVKNWLESFEKALVQEPLDLQDLFVEESWLKDALTLSWDLRTLQGRAKITEYVCENSARNGLFNLKIPQNSCLKPTLKEIGPMVWLESAFNFETKVGQGRGVLRLANTTLGEWKAWILFVKLVELRGHPQRYGLNRIRYRNQPALDPREADDKSQPTAVIIGGGEYRSICHCGLAAAACLQDQGISTLIIDRQQRIGDSWRKRYKRLTLHSPNWADSMPFLEFPSNWPVYPDKDQLADFLEFYARTLDLQIWLGTEFQSAEYNDNLGRWTIEAVSTDGRKRMLYPRHLIYAGSAHVHKHPIIPTIPGQDQFKGLLYHATDHTDAAAMPNVHGKKVVVIGAATTAHDICQDYFEAGADVTMIQRSSTFVLSTEAAAQIALPPPEQGLTFDDYMLGLQSLPTFVLLGMMSGVTARMLQHDSQLIEALDKTEFLVAKGEDGQSFLSRGLMRRGGFYINEGASDSIASGKIKVMQCSQGVAHFTANGLVLADGRSADADIIVFATSWKMFEDVKEEIMGENVSRRTNRTWGVDREGEQGSIYRPTGHPGFWVAISNFMGSRIGSPLLALQIKAREERLDLVST